MGDRYPRATGWTFRVSAPNLAHTCDALGMPPGQDGDDPWASNRIYVTTA